MKGINQYIVEKFKISKDITNKSQINEKEYDVKYEGLTLDDFFTWWQNCTLKEIEDSDFEEFADNSTILKVYFDDDDIEWCSDISKKDFLKIKKLFITHYNEEIILYESKQTNAYEFSFELSFLDKPICIYGQNEYGGSYDKIIQIK